MYHPDGPSIIVHTGAGAATAHRTPRRRRSTRRRFSSIQIDAGSGRSGSSVGGAIALDRLSYLNTALEAVPGITLRQYFLPVMLLRRVVSQRQRMTRERQVTLGPALAAKRRTEALNAIARALTEAAGDLGVTFPVEPKALVELLQDKLEAVSFTPNSVIYYPQEPPEALFVYAVVEGAVSVTQYQPQIGRMTMLGGERKQYFTSGTETLRLCGGGIVEGALLSHATVAEEGGGAAAAEAAANNDAVSVSNMTTAIQRGLREASRAVGQPTLQALRSDLLRAPMVFGAAEALGMAPFKSMSCVAASTTTPKGELLEYTDTYRIRAKDLHAALLSLVQPAPAPAPPHTRRTKGRVGDLLVAAHTKALAAHYYPTEVLLRQSWLLQDTPTATIRNLMSSLVPRTYMPGEVIACPHTASNNSTRQLCFVRRGYIHVTDIPAELQQHGDCQCEAAAAGPRGKVLETVGPGASFGELSVLFGEPRHYVLVAKTICDLWVVSHTDFNRTMRRDDALRHSLVEKAAALRIKWLGEQRFTAALAQRLRGSCELFKPFNDICMRLVQERIQPVVYSPGELITSTSEKCEDMIFIIQGTVKFISGGEVSYGPGDVLGEGCLVTHRWPLGLAARTMVEGWKLHRDQLLDALQRCDLLHESSGQYSSQAAFYMQKIFAPPYPPCETDAVGRQHMPVVGPAPGQMSYVEYGRQVSEIQLRALCFLFRDYVKWEDINYASLPGSSGADASGNSAMARTFAIQKLRSTLGLPSTNTTTSPRLAATGGDVKSPQRRGTTPFAQSGPTPVLAELINSRVSTTGGGKKPKSGTTSTAAAGEPTTAAGKARLMLPRRSNNTGACAFLVDPKVTMHPFIAGGLEQDRRLAARGRPATAPTSGYRPAGADPGADDKNPITAASLARVQQVRRRPQRLHRFLKLLDDRNRTMETEARHEAAAEQQRRLREAEMRGHMQRGGARFTPQQPKKQRPQTLGDGPTSPLFARRRKSTAKTAAAAAAAADQTDEDVLVPVHLFLSAEKPRSEITMAEAVAIGYVMQLPDIGHIQSCVSVVDPDVTVGLPPHRGRRQAMATTPNERHMKHNFLFAASTLADHASTRNDAKVEERLQAEAARRQRAGKLFTMMRANVAPLVIAAPDHGEPLEREDSAEATASAVTPLRRDSSLPYYTNSAVGPGFSSSINTPLRPGSGHGPGTPSPFRASPSRGAEQDQEAFARLLHRDGRKALDLLQQHYVGRRPTSGGGLPSAASTPNTAALVDRLREALDGGAAAAAAAAAEGQEDAEGAPPVVFTNAGAELPPLAVAAPRDYWRTEQYYVPAGGRSATVDHYYTHGEEAVLYVDGYGPLGDPALCSSTPLVLPAPLAAEHPSASRRPSSRRATAWRAAVRQLSATAEMVDGDAENLRGLTPQDFVMPDVDDAAAVVRRIQRDVEGLNAVAAEQARERLADTGLSAATEALLQSPTDEERQLLEDWRVACELRDHDPLQSVEVPAALRPFAGPDYLGRELHRLQEARAPLGEPADRSGVEAWQDEMHRDKSDPSAARRVIATYGTAQFGHPPAALQSPTATLQGEAYQAWVREREAFFAAYARHERGAAAEMPEAPSFVPRAVQPRPASAAVKVMAQKEQEQEREQPFAKELQNELEDQEENQEEDQEEDQEENQEENQEEDQEEDQEEEQEEDQEEEQEEEHEEEQEEEQAMDDQLREAAELETVTSHSLPPVLNA